MSEPSITELSEINKLLKFTLSNVNVSYANGIRRTIISNIPCIVFDTLHDNNQNIIFDINNTRLNNEIIKQRLSCIPIHLKDLDMEIDDYVIEVDVINETPSTIFVTSKDFKIKNIKTDKYLNEATRDKIFPPNDITNMIGEPFLKKSNFYLMEIKNRTSEEGMGLGLFIANILLEKTNGRLKFSNMKQIESDGKKRITGAKVEISWERSSIEVLQWDKKAKMKENPRNVS